MNRLKKKNISIKRALTISEASEYACVSEGTIRNWLAKKIIPFEEFPSRGDGSHKFRLIRKSDLDEFFDKHYKKLQQFDNKWTCEDIILLPKDSH